MRLRFHRVNEVGELHRILDEEHGDIVAHEIPVALVGVELHRETAHVARRVGGAALAGHGGEAHEYRRALARLGKQRRARDLRQRFVTLEIAMRAGSARMHDALGNALVVEVRDLLAQDEVFEQRRPAQPGFQGILVVGNRHALVGGENAIGRVRAHAIERSVGGVESHGGRARTDFGRRIALRQRAAGGGRVPRLTVRAGLRIARGVAVFILLVRVGGHRRGELTGIRHLARGGVVCIQRRLRRRTTHGGTGGGTRGTFGFRLRTRYLAPGFAACHFPVLILRGGGALLAANVFRNDVRRAAESPAPNSAIVATGGCFLGRRTNRIVAPDAQDRRA